MLLITRPIAQTKNLESLLLANEIDYAFFPALEIKKLRPIVLNQKYDVLLKPKHFILFSSDIRYKIINHTKNKSLFFHFTYHNYFKNVIMHGNL